MRIASIRLYQETGSVRFTIGSVFVNDEEEKIEISADECRRLKEHFLHRVGM
jgi:hypothetical protein